MSVLRKVLKQAENDKIIKSNPMNEVEKLVESEKQIVFLTEQELHTISNTDFPNKTLKRAFLFSCHTGLRFSDIKKLQWKEVQISDNKWKIVIHQQKTKGLLEIPLNSTAIALLGTPGKPTEHPFFGLTRGNNASASLKPIMTKAKINKNITFHSGRHTAATRWLGNGVDIYTVMKLLGHKDIQSTMKYVHLLDSLKDDAIYNRTPDVPFSL